MRFDILVNEIVSANLTYRVAILFLVGLFIVSPLWGLASPRLFFVAWLSFLGVLACLFGAARRQVPCRRLARQLFANLTRSLFAFTLLFWGFYLLYFQLPFGTSDSEVLVYWLFSTIQLLFLLPTISATLDELLAKCHQNGERKP